MLRREEVCVVESNHQEKGCSIKSSSVSLRGGVKR